jgi:hypothetical protein
VIEAKKVSKRDDPAQSRAFIEKAREIGADEESSSRAEEIMGKLARMPPKPKKKTASTRT